MALGWLVEFDGSVLRLDEAVRTWALEHARPFPLSIARGVTHLGSPQYAVPLLLLAVGAVGWRRGDAAPVLPAAAGLIALVVSVGVLKAVFGRPGPAGGEVAFLSGAWPSGHTATATVVFGLLAAQAWDGGGRWRPLAYPAAAVPLVVGVGLVYADYHWLSDVAGGLLLGIAIVAGAHRLQRRLPDRSPASAARATASQNLE